ncbi:Homeobox-leucine zipper protein HDG4 [Hirschfeldia incana]|nr:Homeobox-leucine zipper protein HDG4 [Hirschfeldia incana]
MYEDHQVAKSGEEEGHVVANYSDNIFGSASSSPTGPVQNHDFKLSTFGNPNFSYVIPKEEYEMICMTKNGSGWSIGSGINPVEDNVIEQQLPPAKKKRLCNRHSAHQIQEMEAFFNVNPHPNDDDKTRLSEELGLSPLQVKYWFQNRRNQIKIEQGRSENVMLKAENETLKTENRKLQFDLQSLSCSSCGGSRDKLHLENSRLRKKLDRLHSITSLMNPYLPPPEAACVFPDTNNLLITEEDKAIAMGLTLSCVQELAKMCFTNEPLWNKKGADNERISLNEEEYKKMFQWPSMDDNHFRREASRASTVVIMNSITLVNAFLDAGKWSEMFSSIVSKAKTIQIVSSGVSGASGTLLLQNVDAGKWMVVDFPVTGLIKPASDNTATDQYQRKPSGCIIQDMSNGYSQITWVEHVEMEDKHVHHEMVREFVKSGAAFGAERWLAVLRRQCERMASLMATDITDLGVIPSVEAKRNLMKLSQSMVRTFCLTISNSYGQALSESPKETVRITTTKVCGGVVLCAVSTTLLPYSHHQVFDLLRNDHRRSQMEMLFNENQFQEVAHIANGSHPGNCISLLRFHGTSSSSNNVEWMLQETCTDNSGSLVVYSTVYANAVHLAMNGEDPSRIHLLPLGFSVVPVNQPHVFEGISVNLVSCLLTVVVQVLVSEVTTARLDVSTTAINNRICSTVNRISSALGSPLLPEIPSSFKQEMS